MLTKQTAMQPSTLRMRLAFIDVVISSTTSSRISYQGNVKNGPINGNVLPPSERHMKEKDNLKCSHHGRNDMVTKTAVTYV